VYVARVASLPLISQPRGQHEGEVRRRQEVSGKEEAGGTRQEAARYETGGKRQLAQVPRPASLPSLVRWQGGGGDITRYIALGVQEMPDYSLSRKLPDYSLSGKLPDYSLSGKLHQLSSEM